MYNAGVTRGNYYRQMNSTNFKKWIRKQEIPNLLPSSSFIIDNAPYHWRQEDKPLSKHEVKKEVIACLQGREIVSDNNIKIYNLDLGEAN
jgi:hypothetical protein